MPIFSLKSPDLQITGPTIPVTVYPPIAVIRELESKNEVVPSKVLIGLIDTGATGSAFDKSVLSELNLVVRDRQNVITPNGESEHDLYDIFIVLGKHKSGLSVQAFEADFSKQPIDILLGRDILKFCSLIYNGWNNSYDLHLHAAKDIY